MKNSSNPKPCDYYLKKIRESSNRVNFLLSQHQHTSLKSLRAFSEDPGSKTPKADYYKQYVKRKIKKICGNFETALKFVIENQHLYEKEKDSETFVNTEYTVEQDKSEKEESQVTPKPQAGVRLQELKKSTSEARKVRVRKNLTPADKRQCMKEYYLNVVKPNYSPKSRKIELVHNKSSKNI